MTPREELIREYDRWSHTYIKADKRIRTLLHPRLDAPQPNPPLSTESQAKLASAEDDLRDAAARLKEIVAELVRLP